MPRLTFQQAIDRARAGDPQPLVDHHWTRTRVAVLHDGIEQFVNDPPKGVSPLCLAQLESSRVYLRAELDGIDQQDGAA